VTTNNTQMMFTPEQTCLEYGRKRYLWWDHQNRVLREKYILTAALECIDCWHGQKHLGRETGFFSKPFYTVGVGFLRQIEDPHFGVTTCWVVCWLRSWNTRMSRRLLLVLLFIALVALDQVDGGCYPVRCRVSGWTRWSSCRVYGCDGKGLQTRTRWIIKRPRCTRYKCPILCQTKYCQGKPYGKREIIEPNTAHQQNAEWKEIRQVGMDGILRGERRETAEILTPLLSWEFSILKSF